LTGVELLIALDFDGTVAPIQPDPATVAMDPAIAAFLRRASSVRGVVVAIISGRDIDDLKSRTTGLSAYLCGSHGLDIRSPEGEALREVPALDRALDPSLERTAAEAGLRIERKKHAVALHWREAPEIDESHPAIEAFRGWAKTNELELIDGRLVVEARIAGGGKEDALRFLAMATEAQNVVYAGDDLTDFGALRFAAARGHAYFVASDEREAPPVATTVGSRDELLRCLLEDLNRLTDTSAVTE
jgi:trehalose-phosphatase